MIQSLFILSPTGEVLIERHFRGVVTSRSVCDTFWDRASASINHHGGVSAISDHEELYDSVPPVMEVPGSDQGTLYVISCLRDGLSYLAVCPAEVSPLLILEFLHRVADIFVDYFGFPADESAIKDNFSTVYQLLEEMVDYGWPLTTEPNALKAMIRPPTVMSKLLQSTTVVSDELPSGTVSNMPWRTADVSYSQNEIYVDICEEVDAIVDASGAVISSDVSGSIQCQCQLSGVPDLLLTFKDPTIIDDWSFHPCVRYSRYEEDSVVSFVPPDGNFELMSYRIVPEKVRSLNPPVFCHPKWNYGDRSTTSGDMRMGRVTLHAGVTTLSSLVFSPSHKGPVVVEDFCVNIPFPRQTRSTSNLRVDFGTAVYNEAAKVLRWNLGKMDASKKASLTCSFSFVSPKAGEEEALDPPHLSLHWKIPLASVSGLTVSGLSVTRESYHPYKGVRNIAKSGIFQVRCS
ncbi:AP-3 complex subunit mu [Fistulifera solaris]|uniref:AP-3 complex subunit mu n=1 Tax=Fistulifera solaris TaxID=1519565 RepID=A0A1Z5KBS7_FISSO|nr:AP-3 complex subunit mu [Fistulifera solaris]|eukprot:GAX23605.1 AP-3 complex subunit mu [Fistulifera solaris]